MKQEIKFKILLFILHASIIIFKLLNILLLGGRNQKKNINILKEKEDSLEVLNIIDMNLQTE